MRRSPEPSIYFLTMRKLESVYVAVSLIMISVAFIAWRPLAGSMVLSRWHLEGWLFLVATVVLILHATMEGLHWQMGPAYLALFPLAAILVYPAHSIYLSCVASLGLFTSVLFSWLLPIFSFGPLSGPYPVGTCLHHLVDKSRVDSMDPAGGHRQLMIQVWYPAATPHGRRAGYRRRAETTRLSSYQAVVPTRSGWNVPVRELQPLPILIFHPAWNGRRTQNTFLTEDLASRGFFVVAIDHTHNSEPTAFPDGRVVRAPRIPAIEDVSTSTADEVRSIGNAEVRRQAADNAFVLDTLEMWNGQKGSPWSGKLNLAACGVLGHSLGGAVAVECLRFDPRVRAAMNMDGWTFGTPVVEEKTRSVHEERVKRLFFFHEEHRSPDEVVRTQEGVEDELPSVEAELNAWDLANVQTLMARYGGYRLFLRGANHLNFTDRPASSPIRHLAGGGPIAAGRAHRILCDATASFFSQALLGMPAEWLADPAERYAEVRTEASSREEMAESIL